MSRVVSIVVAIAVAIAFTAVAPSLFPALAANHLLLRVVRITIILATIALVRFLFQSASQPSAIDEDPGPASFR